MISVIGHQAWRDGVNECARIHEWGESNPPSAIILNPTVGHGMGTLDAGVVS
jgi:hypothetical protein